MIQSTITQQLINQVIFNWHIIHKVWPFAPLATHLTTLWELAWHLHQPPREYLPGCLYVRSQPWTGLVKLVNHSLFSLEHNETNRNCKNGCTAGQVDSIANKWSIKDYLFGQFLNLTSGQPWTYVQVVRQQNELGIPKRTTVSVEPCLIFLFYGYLFSWLASGWFVIAVCDCISVQEIS